MTTNLNHPINMLRSNAKRNGKAHSKGQVDDASVFKRALRSGSVWDDKVASSWVSFFRFEATLQ